MNETLFPDYVYNSLIIDGHIDLAYNAVVLNRALHLPVSEIRQEEFTNASRSQKFDTCTVSFPALLSGKIAIVGGSIFVEPYMKSHPARNHGYRNQQEARQLALRQLDYYNRVEDEHDFIRLIRQTDDINSVLESWEGDSPQIGIVMMMEGAEPIDNPDLLEWWLEQGVRGIGLTWSVGTRYAGGNAAPGPLTDEGVALLNAMEEYQILLDISHMWVDAAYQALDLYNGPVVATHANPRHFADSPRQLPDKIIHLIAEHGGLVGIAAYAPMLKDTWRISDPLLPLSCMVNAIDYVCQQTGSADYVAIGSDLDGGFGRESTLAELETIADLRKIATELKLRGYSDRDIDAIMYKNWMRILYATLAHMM